MVSTEACCERLLLPPAKTFVWGEVRHISEEQVCWVSVLCVMRLLDQC